MQKKITLFFGLLFPIVYNQTASAVDSLTGINYPSATDTRLVAFADDASTPGASMNFFVAGNFYPNAPGLTQPFLWSSNSSQYTPITVPFGGINSYATGVSGSGTVVGYVDTNPSNTTYRAFVWQNGHRQDLGTLGDSSSNSFAFGISSGTGIVVGQSQLANGNSRGFFWTGSGALQALSTLTGDSSSARAISYDGTTIVGSSTSNINNTEIHAVKWVNGAITDLGTLSGSSYAVATSVSGNGAVVVGWSVISGTTSSFIVNNSPITSLGALTGYANSWANAVSSNGLVVVGDASRYPNCSICAWPDTAYRWTASTGMQTVSQWLASAGVSTGTWALRSAQAVNADGSIVVGYGTPDSTNPYQFQGYIARVSSIGSGLINQAEYLQSVQASNEVYKGITFLTSLPMNGAHHRPLMSYKNIGGDHCAWLNGDFFKFSGASDSKIGMGEIGACTDLADSSIRIGAGIGQNYMWQDTAFSGKNKLDGQHVVGEIDWKSPNSPLLFSATSFYGHWNTDLSRGYMNGGSLDYSRASPNASTVALRGRVDWLEAASLGKVKFNPWASVTATKVTIDAYTETGGGFPARFDKQTRTANEVRLGLTSEMPLTEKTEIRGNIEVAHHIDTKEPSVKGEVIGLFGFNQTGDSLPKTWGRVGLDLDHRFTNSTLISLTVNAAPSGRDANVSGAVSLRTSF